MYGIETKKTSKIFISHSSRDLAFVQPLVELFEHIGLNPENMFCSSVAGYNVPLDSNIYNYLKEQFQSYDLRHFHGKQEDEAGISVSVKGVFWRG